jgi:hypothetical protein
VRCREHLQHCGTKAPLKTVSTSCYLIAWKISTGCLASSLISSRTYENLRLFRLARRKHSVRMGETFGDTSQYPCASRAEREVKRLAKRTDCNLLQKRNPSLDRELGGCEMSEPLARTCLQRDLNDCTGLIYPRSAGRFPIVWTDENSRHREASQRTIGRGQGLPSEDIGRD